MLRFQVQLAATRMQLVQTIVEVEADNAEEAEEIADEMYCDKDTSNELEWKRLGGAGAYDYVESAMVGEVKEL